MGKLPKPSNFTGSGDPDGAKLLVQTDAAAERMDEIRSVITNGGRTRLNSHRPYRDCFATRAPHRVCIYQQASWRGRVWCCSRTLSCAKEPAKSIDEINSVRMGRVTLTSVVDVVIATTNSVVTFINPVPKGSPAWARLMGKGKPIPTCFPIFNSSDAPVDNPVRRLCASGNSLAANHQWYGIAMAAAHCHWRTAPRPFARSVGRLRRS